MDTIIEGQYPKKFGYFIVSLNATSYSPTHYDKVVALTWALYIPFDDTVDSETITVKLNKPAKLTWDEYFKSKGWNGGKMPDQWELGRKYVLYDLVQHQEKCIVSVDNEEELTNRFCRFLYRSIDELDNICILPVGEKFDVEFWLNIIMRRYNYGCLKKPKCCVKPLPVRNIDDLLYGRMKMTFCPSYNAKSASISLYTNQKTCFGVGGSPLREINICIRKLLFYDNKTGNKKSTDDKERSISL